MSLTPATEPITYTTKLDYVADSLTYVGTSLPGSVTSAAVWRIKKLIYSAGNLENVYYADGNGNFDNVWDDRASLSYS